MQSATTVLGVLRERGRRRLSSARGCLCGSCAAEPVSGAKLSVTAKYRVRQGRYQQLCSHSVPQQRPSRRPPRASVSGAVSRPP